ncbi:hypothetical protein [Phascolarctobacterium succinatutens]|uniref:hypothetical protein n=1 Tax=Phascolarctobacterium succinatutens TaxID=626940 RepID=UPI003AF948A4
MNSIDWHKVVIREDCPVKFEVLPREAGWADVNCCINAIEFTSYVATIWHTSIPTGLLETAYFFLDYDNRHENFLVETEEYEGVFVDNDGNEWADVPGKVRFVWDEEPSTYEWNISFDLQYFHKPDAMLNITVKRSSDSENKTYKFNVWLSDFAYAVAKCFTECLKKYGLNTYHFYTWTDDINIRKLLIVKAFALKQMSIDDFIYEFNFEDEMKLLQLDM